MLHVVYLVNLKFKDCFSIDASADIHIAIHIAIHRYVQAFLDFRGFNFRDFQFKAVYNSILFSSPLVLLSNLDLCCFCFPCFFMCPHINSVNQGMPVYQLMGVFCDRLKLCSTANPAAPDCRTKSDIGSKSSHSCSSLV